MPSLGNALQMALGGFSAGVSGYQRAQAQREEEERLKRAEARQLALDKAASDRQAILDAATIRAEERQALGATGNMLSANRYAQMTMPGATPLQPLLRQTIGGKEFVFDPNIDAAEKHREAVLKERGARAKKREEQTAIASSLAAITTPDGKRLFTDEQSAKYAGLPTNERSSVISAAIRAATPERGGKEEPSDDQKRILGAQYLAGQAKNPALMKALQSTYARQPEMANDPEMAAYNIMKSKTVRSIAPFQEYKPPVQKKAGAGDSETVASLLEEVRVGKPAAPAARPSKILQPAEPSAAQPSAMDKELEEQRKLWDDAVAKYGRERVEKEVGRRP